MKTKVIILRITVSLILAVFGTGLAHSQTSETTQSGEAIAVPAETINMLKAIYEGNKFAVRSFQADWLPDGSGYIRLERVSGTGRNALMFYDVTRGEPAGLVSSQQFDSPVSIESYVISDDGKWILLRAESQTTDSRDTGYRMLDRETGKMQKVVAGRNSSISPDGNKILYSDGGNLHIYDIKSEKTIPLTADAVPGEQSYGSTTWSPDSKRIAFVHSEIGRAHV